MKLEYTCDQFRGKLHNLLLADKYCDVILIGADGKIKIPAHRVVLEAASSYIANQIIDADGNVMKEIVVAAIDGATLRQLVGACYSGTVEVDENNVTSVYMGAIHLQLNSLLATIDNYIVTMLNYSNCLHFYHLAQTFSRSMLVKATRNYICTHFIEITKQSPFLALDAKELKDLLALDNLEVPSAEDLFRNVIKWIEYDPKGQRDNVLSDLLPNLRLSSMSPRFLLTDVAAYCKTTEAKDFVIAVHLQSMPPVTTDIKRLSEDVDVGNKLIIITTGFSKKSKILEYSLERKNWNTLAELPTGLDCFSVTHCMTSNSLCFVGGLLNNSPVSGVLFWDLQSHIFKNSKILTEPRAHSAVISLNDNANDEGNGDLIVFGGKNDNSALSKMERWSCKSSEWQSLEPTKDSRWGARLIQIDNLIYCIGGDNKELVNLVECYNLAENRWSTLASLNHARSNFGTWIDGGKLYVMGGLSNVIECYDPKKNEWTEICTVNNSWNIRTCVRHHNRVLALGPYKIFTSDGDWQKWTLSDTIQCPKESTFIYGAFSIPPREEEF